jgi:hypothetical protein
MIKIHTPDINELVGNEIIKNSYTTILHWHKPFIAEVFTWLTGQDVYDGGVYNWPDQSSGSTIRIYPFIITGSTDQLKFRVIVANQGTAIDGIIEGGGIEYTFRPKTIDGIPNPDTDLFDVQTGTAGSLYRFSITLPLAVSWVNPETGIRIFAQGKRTLKLQTEHEVDGTYEEDMISFYVDLRPPNQPLISNSDETVTTRQYNIRATIANLDGGSYIIRVRS